MNEIQETGTEEFAPIIAGADQIKVAQALHIPTDLLYLRALAW
jgi:hypothetical protein